MNNQKDINNIYILIFYSIFYLLIFNDTFIQQNIFFSDGQLNHFFVDVSLWNSSWGSGYYILADSASFNLYPLRILFYNLMPNWLGFNIFILSAYILSSFFTFGYIKSITNSNYASFIGGIVFGFGGFMIAHLWHTNMIHTAIWMPLLLWSAENLKNRITKKWIIIYISSIIMMILAGHLQIFTYSIMLLILYIIFTGSEAKYGFKKYLYLNIFLIIIAVSISMFQLYPTFELAQLGFRKALTFEEFNTYILSFKSLFLLFTPHIFGNDFIGEIKYFGNWNLNELMIYSGIITILISFYIISKEIFRNRLVQFWFFISIFSLLLSLGDNIYLLSKISFEIPILNKFRALARHSMEFTFSISILTSMGIMALLDSKTTIKEGKKYFIFLIIFGIGIFLLLWINYPTIVDMASKQNILLKSFFSNPSIYYFIILYIISIITIWIIVIKKSFITKLLLFVVIIFNLGYFSYFYENKDTISSKNILSINKDLKFIRDNTLKENSRILELDGLSTPLLNPMLSPIYNINTAGWYGPLITKNYTDMTGINSSGHTNYNILINEALLNILNIQYIFANNSLLNKKYSFKLGSMIDKDLKNKENIFLKDDINISKLEIISNLAYSTQIPQGTKIVDIILINNKKEEKLLSIYAGIDTSEWAGECLDVKFILKHKLSRIYNSWISKRAEETCKGHNYISTKNISLDNVKKIKFIWNKQIKSTIINIDKLIILKKNGEKKIVSILDKSPLRITKIINNIKILENINGLEYIELVNNISLLNEKEILNAIRNQKYNTISKIFSSDIDKNYYNKNFDNKYSINMLSRKDGNIKIKINSKSGGYLILKESYHNGWKAYIDGKQTKVYKTNNILNGIFIPKGSHIIEFNFIPTTFIYSLIFSIIILFIFIFLLYNIKIYDIISKKL